MQVKNKTIYYK